MSDKIFIGQFVSLEESYSDVRISQAGNNYQLKLLSMLDPDLCISLYPIFLRLSNIKIFDDKTIIINSCSSLPKKLHEFYRLINDTIKTVKILKRSKIQNAFFYNIDKQNFLLILLTKYLLKKKVFLFLADYPYYKNTNLFDKIVNHLIRNLNGVIVLNSNIKVNKNQKILPGLLQFSQIVCELKYPVNKNVIFSGSLGLTTGILVALETFSKKSDYNLYLTGRPYNFTDEEFQRLIKHYTKKFSNIKYLGLLDYEEYLKVLMNCDIALSLRNPRDIEHQYNFPSKILEYLSKSKIVISSLEYKDLPPELLFKTAFNSDDLGNCLDNISKLDNNKIYKIKKNVDQYLKDTFTEKKLNMICNDLIAYDVSKD